MVTFFPPWNTSFLDVEWYEWYTHFNLEMWFACGIVLSFKTCWLDLKLFLLLFYEFFWFFIDFYKKFFGILVLYLLQTFSERNFDNSMKPVAPKPQECNFDAHPREALIAKLVIMHYISLHVIYIGMYLK